MTPYLDGLLRNIHSEAAASRVEALRRLRARVRGPQLRDPRVRRAVAAALDDPHPGVRRMACWLVTEVWDWHVRAGRTPEPPFDDAAVLRLLDDPHPLTRIIVVERMAGRGDERAVPAILNLIDDPCPGLVVRRHGCNDTRAGVAAVTLLRHLSGDRSAALLELFVEPLLAAGDRTAATLAEIAQDAGPAVVTSIATRMDDPVLGSRTAAALGRIAASAGWRQSGQDNVRRAAVAALVDVGLPHPSADVRWASAAAFTWTLPVEPEVFVPLLADPSVEVVARAVRVLGRCDQASIQRKLRQLLTDERPVSHHLPTEWGYLSSESRPWRWLQLKGPVPLFFHVLVVLEERAWRSRPDAWGRPLSDHRLD